METSNPAFFSLLFFLVCSVSALLGIYVITANPKGGLNRSFFSVCICLCIWSFGFSVAIIAPNEATCLIWRRFSAIGWGSFYAALLHFILLFTERRNILKKTWIYPLIYLPALICIFVFGISASMAKAQYHLINRELGWVNVSVNNGWNYFFYGYFTAFLVVGLVLLWKWRTVAPTEENKAQAKIIFGTISLVAGIGVFTDLINNRFLVLELPQMAPILLTLLLISICYCMRKFRFMNKTIVDDPKVILNESSRSKIYIFSLAAMFVGSFVYFICQYVLSHNETLLSSLSTSASLIILSAVLYICQRKIHNKRDLESIYNFIIVLTIPIFTIKLIAYTDDVIWAFPFVFIIGALVFNRRTVLIATTFSIFVTQLYVWISASSLHYTMSSAAFIGRLSLYLAAVLFAFYVNKIYLLRLKENAEQVQVQKIASELSTAFVTVNPLNIESKIGNTLEKVGMLFSVDHVSLCIQDKDYQFSKQSNTLHWYRDNFVHKCNDEFNAEWIDEMMQNSIVHIPDTSKLPKHASAIRQRLKERHIQSFLSMPITVRNRAVGRLNLESGMPVKKWSLSRMNLLELITNIVSDAVVKVNSEKTIHLMAYYDSLTKLPNRLLFKEHVERAINRAKELGHSIGMIFLDLDSFKDVNDTLGHEEGDLLIQKVTRQLNRCVREADMISRFGGDEFLIMINNVSDPKEVTHTVEKIMDLFSTSFMLHEQEVFVTASAGIALFPQDGEDTETLVKNADTAMYEAKGKGKNQYARCTTDMKDKLQAKMRLMNSLYYALEREEMVINYQPQVSVRSEKVVGVEALLRWNHTELGMISPEVFIPLAEQTGLINQIGEWVLRTACSQARAWQKMGLPQIRVAVNASAVQLRNPLFVQQVKQVLEETGLNPELLEIEITESATIKDFEYIVQVLNQLKALGVSLSIDDFGTKYSSLGRLKKLPVDRLKMDMQFVKDIGNSVKGTGITKAIINLAKNLDLQLIAEGVENQIQLDFLRTWHCDEVQGYYYYRPMHANEIEQILSKMKVFDTRG